MDTKNFEEEKDTITFDFFGTARKANKLRRIFLAYIPVIAPYSIQIFRNESIATDNFLLDRIRLIPVLDRNCEKTLFINKTGGTVYSHDIIDSKGNSPMFKNIIVTVLKENHTLEMEVNLTENNGLFHEAWKAVGLATFRKVEENQFKFQVENYGQYTNQELFDKAVNIYNTSTE